MSLISKSRVVKAVEVCRRKFIVLKELHWTDPTGKARLWESCERTTRKADVDAVEILAFVKRKSRPTSIVLVKQFRPAVGAITVETPAGLVDEGETAVVAAHRELKEETGYVGVVQDVSEQVCADPGLTNANFRVVTMVVDGDSAVNQTPIASLDDGEFIDVVEVQLPHLLATLKKYQRDGEHIDSRLYHTAHTLQMTRPGGLLASL